MKVVWLQRKYWLLAVVLIGVLIAVLMNKSSPPVLHKSDVQQGIPAAYIELSKQKVRPVIVGYGEVEPDTLLQTRAEVSGKITFLHENLELGAVLEEGVLVLRIDDRDYQLALNRAQASLVQSQANLKQQQLNLANAQRDLALAQDKLALAEEELARLERLFKKGSVSQSQRDGQKSAVIQLRQEVQSLSSNLETLPQQIAVQKAQIDIADAEVATQQRNLERTEIRLPFTARVSQVNVEQSEFVSAGTTLFSAQSLDRVRINAQFPLSQFRVLAKGFQPFPEQYPTQGLDARLQNYVKQLDLGATVRLIEDFEVEWQGKVEQITGTLDPASRTLGVSVVVEQPFRRLQPGVRPPLIQGMYTQVELMGSPQDYFVIPRAAIHQKELYLVDAESRLERRKIKGIELDEMLLVEPGEGLEDGARLVTTDLFPAIPQMLLQPILDQAAAANLQLWLEAH